MEILQEIAIDSTDLRQKIDQEICLIPDEKLVGLYQFIHYFRLGVQVASNGAMVSGNGSHPEYLNHKDESEIVADENDSATDGNEHDISSGERILSFAGAWSDMPDEEFDGFLNEVYARRRGEHLVVAEA